MKKFSLMAVLAASTALVAVDANAAFINGAFGASNSFGGIKNAPVAPTNALLPVALIFNDGSGSGNGDLAGLVNALTSVSPFSQPSGAAIPFSVSAGIFTWTIGAINPAVPATGVLIAADCIGSSCSQGFQYQVSGSVDDGAGGFQATAFTGVFSASATCADQVVNALCDAPASQNSAWTFTASSAGIQAPPPPPPPQVPAPATLALLGAALVGLSVSRRRRG